MHSYNSILVMKKFTFLIFCMVLFNPLNAQIITTIAGNLQDGLQAINSSVTEPIGLAIDKSGNIYFAEYESNRIRKISACTGIITTIAGNEIMGFSGDGGPATSASLNNPSSIAIDNRGDIYISDWRNYRIRKVSATTGIITTVAGNGLNGFSGDGNLATLARISDLGQMAVDTFGNIYFVDRTNNRIRKVSASTGNISTIAGDGTTHLIYQPYGIVCDNSGNLYLSSNNQILKLVINSGELTTLKTYPSGYTKPGYMALDASGNIYFVDGIYPWIQKVSISTGTTTTVAGNETKGNSGDDSLATLAKLWSTSAIAFDPAGNFYISDFYNNSIRKVTLNTGIITTIAGNGNKVGDGNAASSSFLNYPSQTVIDRSGNMYIADQDNNRIRKVEAKTGIISTIAGTGIAGYNGDNIPAISALLNYPSGIALDRIGDIYIADQVNNRIRKITAITGLITTIAGIEVAGYNGDSILAISAKINDPEGIALDSSGSIYFCDRGNSRIRKITATTGIITNVAGNGTFGFSGDNSNATLAKIGGPNGIAIDGSGNIYFSEDLNHRIRKVTANTGIITTVAGNGIAGYGGDSDSATLAKINSPRGIAIDGSGNIYIADFGNNRIRMITNSTGIISTVAGVGVHGFSGDGGPANQASLSGPMGVCIDSIGNLYIADFGNHRIRKVSSSTSHELDFMVNTNFPAKQDTVVFKALFNDTLSFYHWSIVPNNFICLAGTDSFSGQPKIKFTRFGEYHVKLIAGYKGDTLSKLKSKYISVIAPSFDFTVDNTSPSIFDTLSLKAFFNDSIQFFHWSISPKTFNYILGTDSTSAAPKIAIIKRGNYSVKLTIITQGDTLTKNKINYISVLKPLLTPLDFTTNNRVPTLSDTVSLKALFLDSLSYYEWSILPNNYNFLLGSNANSASPKLVFNKAGVYNVSLKAIYESDTLTLSKSGYIIVLANALPTNSNNPKLTIYPNPTHQSITIELEEARDGGQCEVYNACGNLMSTYTLNTTNTEILLPEANGMYLLKILTTNGNNILRKVMKE